MGSCLSDHCRSEWRQHLPYHWRQPVDTIRMECVLSFSSSDVLLSVAARSLSDFGCKLVKVREFSLYEFLRVLSGGNHLANTPLHFDGLCRRFSGPLVDLNLVDHRADFHRSAIRDLVLLQDTFVGGERCVTPEFRIGRVERRTFGDRRPLGQEAENRL